MATSDPYDPNSYTTSATIGNATTWTTQSGNGVVYSQPPGVYPTYPQTPVDFSPEDYLILKSLVAKIREKTLTQPADTLESAIDQAVRELGGK
jgi:hypothetical protein